MLLSRALGLLFSWLYCVCRADIGARSAISAQIRIDGVFVIAFTDSLNRTLVDTGPTANTFISNYISHFCSPFLIFCKVGIEIIRKWQVFFCFFLRVVILCTTGMRISPEVCAQPVFSATVKGRHEG